MINYVKLQCNLMKEMDNVCICSVIPVKVEGI